MCYVFAELVFFLQFTFIFQRQMITKLIVSSETRTNKIVSI